jgi:glycosyltransferase involved in cell wall biosynthesis
VARDEQPLRILFATPAYWPSTAFGGPIQVFRSLVSGLVARGHSVDVVTSSLAELGRGAKTTTRQELDGAQVLRAATPVSYRWMGVTPTLPLLLRKLERPDVAHVFGFRDPVGTIVARWCRKHGVPYAFEALGMFEPKLRKVRLKLILDSTLFRTTYRKAALFVATSAREADEYRAAGIPGESIVERPNGFPDPIGAVARPGRLRTLLGLDAETPLVLSVGRVARGKGLELLLEAARGLPTDTHVAIVGPDERHGMVAELTRLRDAWGLRDRVHLVGPLPAPLLDVYSDADVFVLASAHENFGLVAAEAAAAGTPSVLSDRTGASELLADRAAIVVPYDAASVEGAIARLLGDADLRLRLGAGGREVAAEHSWPMVVAQQETIYRRMLRA